MLQTAHAIVLKTIRYGDRSVVVKTWTTHAGARSYMVRTGAKNGGSMAALQPLNRIELVADERPDADMHTAREVRVEKPYLNVHRDPIRGSLILFTQEVLYRVLWAEAADPSLDAFVREALETIDTSDVLQGYPLIFLLQLSGHLGFFPEYPSPGADHFDLMAGCFVPAGVPHGHTLAPPLSNALVRLLDIDLDALEEVVLPASQRRDLLDHLLLYFRLHVDGLGELRSPAVLHATLS
ncbi:MAG: recombination protein O N-terminal domain-containing protein [Flavobacteriales bacterium]|nr:recombination protein O N-terminal domain-containing protein [Flavobacteriales bacterium]